MPDPNYAREKFGLAESKLDGTRSGLKAAARDLVVVQEADVREGCAMRDPHLP